jgi:segregation and condensation protein B
MELARLKSILEALILVSEEPLTVSAMLLILELDGVTKADVETAIEEIKTKYVSDEACGFSLEVIAGGYQFRTKPSVANYIQRLNMPKPTRLSQAALETLAIVAYRQPVVRSELEEIRGVDSGGVLKTLLERNLIKVIGRRDEAGNPLIYATTSKFLELFNLSSLKELPTLREYEDLEKEHYKGKENPEEESKPILDGVDANPFAEKWSGEDDSMINDLTDSVKRLRRLEKEIFPKPVETIVAVPNPEQASVDATGESLSIPSEIQDADTTPEDTGSRNQPV